MASAIFHIHFIVYTFHIDIKPANFLLDTNKDLILIDWEQSRVLLYTLVPEANSFWDIKESRTGSSVCNRVDLVVSKLIYRKYYSPYRKNLA
jgi:serine/threonine protein kinase